MELLRTCGRVLGFCFGVMLVIPPVIFLWWALILHDFLWREIYQQLSAEFPGTDFLRDVTLICVLQILIPTVAGYLFVRGLFPRFSRGWTSKVGAAFLLLTGAGFCLLARATETTPTGPAFYVESALAWFVFAIWSSTLAGSWQRFRCEEESGSFERQTQGAELWSWFSEGVMSVGRFVNRETRTPNLHAFGRTSHPSEAEINAAGLVSHE